MLEVHTVSPKTSLQLVLQYIGCQSSVHTILGEKSQQTGFQAAAQAFSQIISILLPLRLWQGNSKAMWNFPWRKGMLKRVIVFWVCKTGICTVTKCCHALGYLLMVLNRLTLIYCYIFWWKTDIDQCVPMCWLWYKLFDSNSAFMNLVYYNDYYSSVTVDIS